MNVETRFAKLIFVTAWFGLARAEGCIRILLCALFGIGGQRGREIYYRILDEPLISKYF